MGQTKKSESYNGDSLPTTYTTSKKSDTESTKRNNLKGKRKDLQIHRTQTWHGYAFRKRNPKIRTFGKYCPLVSAIFAPLSTLLDIPALTQHWYAQNGVPLPDPTACLTLSAIGLALNIIANILLVMRFSAKSTWWWKHSTRWSLLCWLGKTIVAAINLIIFGILSRNGQGYTYLEGFWCAVLSLIDAGIISITLLFHYFFAFSKEIEDKERQVKQGKQGKGNDQNEIRSEGRRFMLSVTTFISILAIQSLVFSKIENDWSYSDGIYFSTQVALTIGYGDFVPTKPLSKFLVFPFSVLTISQLGNEIAQIIGFISKRADLRREKWRKKYEHAMHKEANKKRPKANLTEEMALIHQINQREEMMSQMYDLFWSALSLIVFWVIGATAFSQIEGWPYGDAVYVVMILSLTIGFGDFTPKQPAGKVVFIVYALMAVPIVTSFAVQTITGLLSTYSERGAAREAFLAEQQRTPEAFAPHADFILKYHESYSEMRQRLMREEEEAEREEQDVGGKADTERLNNDDDEVEEDNSAHQVKGLSDQGDQGDTSDNNDVGETDSHLTIENSDEDVEDDPSNFTLSGKRKKAGRHLNSAEEQLRNDYDHARDIIEERKEEAENWEETKIEHQNEHPRISMNIKKRDPRGRQDTQRTMVEQDDSIIGGSSKGGAKESKSMPSKNKSEQLESEERKLEVDLLEQLMRKTIQLEAEARQMLLDSMGKGVARTLLLADRNVQARDVRALKGDDKDIMAIWYGESEETEKSKNQANVDIQKRGKDNNNGQMDNSTTEQSKGQLDMLSRVRRYRNTFAEILVVGSILQKLEGEEKERFERWREDENEENADEPDDDDDDIGVDGQQAHKAKSNKDLQSNGKQSRLGRNQHQQQRQHQDENLTETRERELQEEEQGEDIEKVANNTWDGLTFRIYKRWARKVREKDLQKWETV
ncbi:uncharacterized protein L201_004681 [Kwoniella dendrophila CBS 6074]|uniref:Potassium channel domain-containing protein n=1 Tax=Kwoniella dendrophila CBS 6074 TaxID=1295534 RepID=A0AAX4JWD5_9TREE